MNKCKNISLFLIPLLIVFCSGIQKGNAQDTLRVEIIPSTTIVDVCKSEKRIEVYVQTNEIYAKDSLIGYDFYIEYDPGKILIEQPLKNNTLTSQIEASGGFSYFGLLEPGLYHAVAFIQSGNIFIKGSAPLIAFKGSYKDSCEGIGSIKISDFEAEYADITSKRNTKIGEEKYIKGEVADIKGRGFNVLFSSHSFEIDKHDSTIDVDVIFQYQFGSQIKSADVIFKIDSSDLLVIDSIKTLQGDIEIDTIIIKKDSTVLRIKLGQNFQTSLPAIRLKLKSLKDTNFISPIIAIISQINNCNCIKKLNGDLATITKIKSDTAVSVVEVLHSNVEVRLIENEGNLKILSNYQIKEIAIYNTLGIEMDRQKIEYPSLEVSLPQKLVQNGVYIVEVITNAENKRKYIKFIK